MSHPIRDSHELVAHYRRFSGGHFFDPDTMRSFGSRVLGPVFNAPDGLIYFVTSERDRSYSRLGPAWGGSRRYTVRVYNPANHKIGAPQEDGFGKYSYREGALRVARAYAQGSGDGWTAKHTDYTYFMSHE